VTDHVLLEVRNLIKRFPIDGSEHVVHACEDVTLTLHRGEMLGLIGESGSGKTTLGRCVLRLVEPTSGEIIFEGQDITKLSKRDLRQARCHMHIVFQEPFDSLNPQLTIGYQIAEPLRIHTKMSRAERKERVRELLKLVGLPTSVADAVPGSLSTGALQRCSIARAVATRPKLLVLDEPTSALAPESEGEVIALIKDLQTKLELSCIFISHDLSLIRSICDRVAVMYLSQVVEIGERDAIFARPRHPYTRALLASVLLPDPAQRRDLSDRAERLEGEIPSPIDLPRGCYLASRCPHVRPRCRDEPQELLAVDTEHLARCWRMTEGDLTQEELDMIRERARAAAQPAPSTNEPRGR
jgi:oligopeptide/dipeptide ABC transporter ATP-binding protein